MKRIALYIIGLYARFLRPFTWGSCRFYPSCSEYAHGAISKHGFLRGTLQGIWRIIRCSPLTRARVDLP